MPYVRSRSYRSRTRSAKRYSRNRKGLRKRFARKRFAKNTQAMKKQVISRELYVKLPVMYTDKNTVALSSSLRYVFYGNSIAPVQLANCGVASASFPTASFSNVVTAGDPFPSGLVEYGTFFSKARALGSSISIQTVNTTPLGTRNLRAVLLCVPVSLDDTTSSVASVTSMILQLDTYSFEELAQDPRCQYRLTGTGYDSAKIGFKRFAKTKSMLGIKDVRDNGAIIDQMPNSFAQDGALRHDDQAVYTNPASTFQTATAPTYFIWYYRLFNTATDGLINVDTLVKIKTYYHLFGRRFYQQLDSTQPIE